MCLSVSVKGLIRRSDLRWNHHELLCYFVDAHVMFPQSRTPCRAACPPHCLTGVSLGSGPSIPEPSRCCGGGGGIHSLESEGGITLRETGRRSTFSRRHGAHRGIPVAFTSAVFFLTDHNDFEAYELKTPGASSHQTHTASWLPCWARCPTPREDVRSHGSRPDTSTASLIPKPRDQHDVCLERSSRGTSREFILFPTIVSLSHHD